jgi:hypothetical protein
MAFAPPSVASAVSTSSAARGASTRGALDDAHPIDGVDAARCDARRRSTRGERANRLAARAPATKTPRRARRRAGACYHRARASTRERARSLSRATTTRRRRIDGCVVGSHRERRFQSRAYLHSSADPRDVGASRPPRTRRQKRENLTRRMFATNAAPRAVARRRATTPRRSRKRITTIASATRTPEARATEAQRWIDAWKSGETKANQAPVAKTPGESARELRDGELAIKKGLLGSFIKEGKKEVTAEDYRKFQAEIAAKKAEAQRKMKEARANKKGPFGLW